MDWIVWVGLCLISLMPQPDTVVPSETIAPIIASVPDTEATIMSEAGVPVVANAEYADVIMTLERTPCFGSCPIYRLTIHGDGTVIYEGIDHVAVKGRRTAHLSSEQVEQLVRAFEQANFFALQDEYTIEVTDLPGVITSIQRDGQTKRVWHYGSNFPEDSAPAELRELENQIDAIVNSPQWIEG